MPGIISILFLLGGICLSAGLAAQTADTVRPPFEWIQSSDLRLKSNNAALLFALPVQRMSIAEADFNKSNGNFTDYAQSGNSYTFGAHTESYVRLSPRLLLHGGITYDHFKGKQMGGSAFIYPADNAFDIVEYADSTRGEKKLEKYRLQGAFAIGLNKRLSAGAKIDYTAANYAKYKDLRHKNKRMDMTLTFGLNYRLNNMLAMGGNYYYRRSTEGIVFNTYGTTDRQYHSLISYGAFYGRRELFGESGFTDKGTDHPLFDKYQGGSVQIDGSLSEKTRFFNELAYFSRKGYFGENSSGSTQFTSHHARVWKYNGQMTHKNKQALHLYTLQLHHENLENNENIYRQQTTPGGVTEQIYYGKNKVLQRKTLRAQFEYAAHLKLSDYEPQWSFSAKADYFGREQTVSVYPYFRKQTLRSWQANLNAYRYIRCKSNSYRLAFGAGYGSGNGTPLKDGLYAKPSDEQAAPAGQEQLLHKEFEYLTAPQGNVKIGFRYSKPLLAEKSIDGYVEINYQLVKAFQTLYTGNHFHVAGLKIGCAF